MYSDQFLDKFTLPDDTHRALCANTHLCFPETLDELRELCYGPCHADIFNVTYDIEGRGEVCEAVVHRCKNGVSVNFTEDYMRRRDGDSMRIGDDLPSDKPRFRDTFGYDFAALRCETLTWLSAQKLIVLPFYAGGARLKIPALLLCPMNAAFFALSLALMQGFVSIEDVPDGFTPEGIIYAAPPFRHTHFSGKQIVVHCRQEGLHEIFAYNLYPGPSAKKGVFSMLLDFGERVGQICCHASATLAESPYESRVLFMHEGASGGGKSEMLEPVHPDTQGCVLLARNGVSGSEEYIRLGETCRLHPICDDMALAGCAADERGRLIISDAEAGWFLRMDGERGYGSSPVFERLSIHPPQPLEFFNMDCVSGSTCLIWEHTRETSGKPCSNPRVIIPREALGSLPREEVHGVDVRSFGVRMPPSTAEQPDIGVMGLIQVVPTSLAWLWRLVSPRGYNNPSIAPDSGGRRLAGEGVGSYWPFATGLRITQANMLLRQMLATGGTLNILIPNQYIGAYEVGFAGEWLVREYLARRGAKIGEKHLVPARCALFGYALDEMKINSQLIPAYLLRPELQPSLGTEGYDIGAKKLTEFFKAELQMYDISALDPIGQEILTLFRNDAPLDEYVKLTPMRV